MEFIKEYEIDVTGSTQGIDGAIPVNHRLGVCEAKIYRDNIADEWLLQMKVCTYLDNTYGKEIANDNIPNNWLVANLGSSLPTSGIKTLVKNEMNTILDGFANVGIGNYTEDPA